MTGEPLEERIEAAISAARVDVKQRIVQSGIDVNVAPDIPDTLIAEMDPELTVD